MSNPNENFANKGNPQRHPDDGPPYDGELGQDIIERAGDLSAKPPTKAEIRETLTTIGYVNPNPGARHAFHEAVREAIEAAPFRAPFTGDKPTEQLNTLSASTDPATVLGETGVTGSGTPPADEAAPPRIDPNQLQVPKPPIPGAK
jgi:hypothetical protein